MSEWPTYPPSDESGGLQPWVNPAAPPDRPDEIPPAASPPMDPLRRLAMRGKTADNPVVYSTGGGGDSFRKSGEWVVPAYIRVKGGFGSVVLDMQRATASSQVISVEVEGSFGEIAIILPEGWGADLSDVGGSLGTRKSKVADQPVSGFPFLYLTGSLSLGSLVIRHPSKFDVWRMEREIKKERRRKEQTYR